MSDPTTYGVVEYSEHGGTNTDDLEEARRIAVEESENDYPAIYAITDGGYEVLEFYFDGKRYVPAAPAGSDE